MLTYLNPDAFKAMHWSVSHSVEGLHRGSFSRPAYFRPFDCVDNRRRVNLTLGIKSPFS